MTKVSTWKFIFSADIFVIFYIPVLLDSFYLNKTRLGCKTSQPNFALEGNQRLSDAEKIDLTQNNSITTTSDSQLNQWCSLSRDRYLSVSARSRYIINVSVSARSGNPLSRSRLGLRDLGVSVSARSRDFEVTVSALSPQDPDWTMEASRSPTSQVETYYSEDSLDSFFEQSSATTSHHWAANLSAYWLPAGGFDINCLHYGRHWYQFANKLRINRGIDSALPTDIARPNTMTSNTLATAQMWHQRWIMVDFDSNVLTNFCCPCVFLCNFY